MDDDEDATPLNKSDITFPTANETFHVDIMVTSATTQSAHAGAMRAITPGLANTQAEQKKRWKYGTHPVTPAVFEAHGRVGDTLQQFLKQLTSTLPTPQEQTSAYYYCLQRLSTTLQRHNATTINTQVKTHTTPPQTAAPQAHVVPP